MANLLRWLRRFIIEALYKGAVKQYARSVSLLLGFITAILLLSSNAIANDFAAIIFGAAVVLTAVLFISRPLTERKARSFGWGHIVLIVLGFGLGALVHQYREWGVWLWINYRRIHYPKDLLLESLFLLGIIMGFFIVRNWAKDQKEFVASISAVLSGAFLATILGKLSAEDPLDSFAYYALGFTISGVIILGCAALLSASYTNKQSITSRAVLDFLYGPERATAIDGYFLKNFKDDPDYAKAALVDAVTRYKHIVLREFSEKMESRRIELHPKDPDLQEPDPQKPDLKKPDAPRQGYYYQLLSIECQKQKRKNENIGRNSSGSPPQSPPENRPEISPDDKQYMVLLRRVDEIREDMFRVGVTVKRKDTLEYIVAPGEYKDSFPYFGSTAGLSLKARVTIVMNRDRYKKFRTKEYRDGRCPDEIEQSRGLDEVDFLSYISIPVIARAGTRQETELGVVNVDTRLFVTPEKLEADPADKLAALRKAHVRDGRNLEFKMAIDPETLTEYAIGLYDQADKNIAQLERLTETLIPILDLYLKCLVGAT
jgi:hypothetical protein